MKFVSKVVIFNKIKKNPGGPPKELRGPSVEKHCSKTLQKVVKP